MVTVILALLLIGYLLNAVLYTAAAIVGPDAKKRGTALLSLLFTILAAAGTIYLAVN
jgi:hypothetical protein